MDDLLEDFEDDAEKEVAGSPEEEVPLILGIEDEDEDESEDKLLQDFGMSRIDEFGALEDPESEF